jgi:hypothetical protein
LPVGPAANAVGTSKSAIDARKTQSCRPKILFIPSSEAPQCLNRPPEDQACPSEGSLTVVSR